MTTHYGTDASETIIGSVFYDYLYGFGGNDRIFGYSDKDHLDGGAGADRLDAGAQDDVLYGGDGADLLVAGAGDDYVSGGAGGDRTLGGMGDDTFAFTSFSEMRGDVAAGDVGYDSLYVSFAGILRGVTFAAPDPSVARGVFAACASRASSASPSPERGSRTQ